MNDHEQLECCARMLAQARRFAGAGNYGEAAARARRLVAELRPDLPSDRGPRTPGQRDLQMLLQRAAELEQRWHEAHVHEQARIAQKRAQSAAHAAELFARPLPTAKSGP